ncbi:alpha/beta hydrolase [Anaerococcus kampingiae]|uniref:Alpha/beta hydrolase n=1 Tax=Anaerococcus kampingae TaxID=3115614 RepID=A0ABW9MFX6_9FIRM
MTKDLYPNHSLEEIINDMDTNDRKRLAKQSYPTDGVIVKSDLAYINDRDDFHLFDIYYNEENKGKTLPTIINIHGGGLVYGRKELNRNINIEFARAGFNVAALNYRLLPQVSLKEQISDIISGISFIYNNHEKFDLNMDKLFISADSAGAYLAMAAFAIINSGELQDLFGISCPKIEIDGMVFISPMTRLADDGSFSSINEFVIGGLNHDDLKTYAKNMIKIFDKVNPCPIFIQTSKEDFIRDHSYDLRDYLDEGSGFYEFADFGKGIDQALGHVFPVCYPKWPESIIAIGQMVLFLKNL